MNFGQHLNDKWSYKVSYIKRDLTVTDSEFNTSIISNEMEYKYSYKYLFKSLISVESLSTLDKDYNFLKFGISGNLVF